MPTPESSSSRPAGTPRRGRARRRDSFAFEPPPVDRPRLRGSAQILGHLRVRYEFPGDGGLPPGTLVSLLLDRHSSVVGVARLRAIDPAMDRQGKCDAVQLLLEQQARDPRGADGFACLLVAYRPGPAQLLDQDRWLWAGLPSAARREGLHPADVLVSTPAGWFTIRAGTSGPPEPALEQSSGWGTHQNGIVTNGEE